MNQKPVVIHLDKDTMDSRQLRNALGRFTTGVTVITTSGPGGKLEGLTANSFAALSLDPPLVLWSLNRSSLSLPGFRKAGYFAVNVLSSSQIDISHKFATRAHDKFYGVRYTHGAGGCPVIDSVIAAFECRTQQMIEGGDHVLFLGEVVALSYREGEPLIFSSGNYCTPELIRGESAADDLIEIWGGLG
jgi:flavin reductase (DIM6/NTAB) family NADH-FMN oxidoreductase RutF